MINCSTLCWNKYDYGFKKFIYNSYSLRNDEDNLGCIQMYTFYSYALNVVVACLNIYLSRRKRIIGPILLQSIEEFSSTSK